MLQFTIGVVIGCITMLLIFHFSSAHGTLKVDTSDQNTDRFRIVVDKLDTLETYDRMILRIVHEDLSQE